MALAIGRIYGNCRPKQRCPCTFVDDVSCRHDEIRLKAGSRSGEPFGHRMLLMLLAYQHSHEHRVQGCQLSDVDTQLPSERCFYISRSAPSTAHPNNALSNAPPTVPEPKSPMTMNLSSDGLARVSAWDRRTVDVRALAEGWHARSAEKATFVRVRD